MCLIWWFQHYQHSRVRHLPFWISRRIWRRSFRQNVVFLPPHLGRWFLKIPTEPKIERENLKIRRICFSLGCVFPRYQKYGELRWMINEHIGRKDARILIVGCGTSNLSDDMVKDGYTNIVNIDVSSVRPSLFISEWPSLTTVPVWDHLWPRRATCFPPRTDHLFSVDHLFSTLYRNMGPPEIFGWWPPCFILAPVYVSP